VIKTSLYFYSNLSVNGHISMIISSRTLIESRKVFVIKLYFSQEGPQICENVFLWGVCDLHISIFLLLFLGSENVFNNKPAPDIVQRAMGFNVTPPTTVPATNQGRVVRKPVNASQGLKVNRSVNFFLDKNVFDCSSFA